MSLPQPKIWPVPDKGIAGQVRIGGRWIPLMPPWSQFYFGPVTTWRHPLTNELFCGDTMTEKHEYLPDGVISLGDGWSYAVSDFNNGWVLFRDGQFLRTADGHPILFPSVLTIKTWLNNNHGWPDPFLDPGPSEAGIVTPGS